MKIRTNIMRVLTATLLLATVSLTGCVEDKCDLEYTFSRYSPVYMSLEDFRNAVSVEAPQAVQNPGKIYVKDNYLFVSEIAKGVHIFDNKNPESPVAIAYINVPGNYDIAFNCDKLYLDSSTDLLVFDLNNPSQPQLINRVENALPHIVSYRGYTADANKGVVVEWVQEIATEKYNCETGIPTLWLDNQADATTIASMNGATSRTINPATPGKGGSMSRFAVSDDYMYVVTPTQMVVYNASVCESPSRMNTLDLELWGGEAEMIFSMDNLLMIGSTSSMMIYDAVDPVRPVFLSNFQHVTACDPVTAKDGYAYVTLRGGNDNPCGDGFANQLDVLNISEPRLPFLVKSFPMTAPAGLGLDGNLLFIADGASGLRVFDATNPEKVGDNQLANFPAMEGYDLIPNEGVLIMVGEDGIAQYDYADPKNIKRLSTIAVER
ncbi:MAG: hypothetical protein SF052_00980 [Bacteroidia bacterium]|nr:hypothetical protein [Bacteroidia bacterium]